MELGDGGELPLPLRRRRLRSAQLTLCAQQDAHALYRKPPLNFVDVHARSWCILRWPGEVPLQSELAPPAPLPSSYRLASTRAELRNHAPAVAQALLDLPELLPGKQRTREMVKGQLEASAGVIVLQAKEGKGEEAVGYARVVNDGEG